MTLLQIPTKERNPIDMVSRFNAKSVRRLVIKLIKVFNWGTLSRIMTQKVLQLFYPIMQLLTHVIMIGY